MSENNPDLLHTFNVMAAELPSVLTTHLHQEKVIVMHNHEYLFLKVNDICYVEAAGSYSNIFLLNGKKIVVSLNLKRILEKLSREMFYRTHKSYVINLSFISKYAKSNGGYIIMEDGSFIPDSAKRKDFILQLIEKLCIRVSSDLVRATSHKIGKGTKCTNK